MTRDEIMQMAAEKAVAELEWDSIEWLFKPITMFELLVRIDLEGMQKKVNDWFFDESPDAMPHRFRREPLTIMERVIKVEEFYRKLLEVRDAA